MAKRLIWLDDDSWSALMAYVDELEDEGYEVAFVRTQTEFRAELERKSSDISALIMDILMPVGEMDPNRAERGRSTGLRILEDVRDDARFNRLPVIIFTILDDQNVKQWVKKNDRVQHLRKQYTTPSQLASVVNALIGGDEKN